MTENKPFGFGVIKASRMIIFFLVTLFIGACSIIHIPFKIYIIAFIIGVVLSPLVIITYKTGSILFAGLYGLCLGLILFYFKQYFENNNLDVNGIINFILAMGIGLMLILATFEKKLIKYLGGNGKTFPRVEG